MPRLSDLMPKTELDDTVRFFSYLYERWQDEREYEDFNEYVESMRKKLGDKVTDVKMTKKPFRVTFVLSGQKCYVQVKRGSVEWGTMGTSAPTPAPSVN
jgi:hypothetical protein